MITNQDKAKAMTIECTLLTIKYPPDLPDDGECCGTWIVASFRSGTGGVVFTATGKVIRPHVGCKYKLTGRWDRHPRFGDQFKFEGYEKSEPTSEEGLKHYLESAPGIGYTLSRRIVDRYKIDTLDVCKAEPGRVVSEVLGMTEDRAKGLAEWLLSNAGLERATVWLNQIGDGLWGAKTTERIATKYKGQTVEKLTANPYLLTRVWGIGFTKADLIATGKLGYDRKGHDRIVSGVIHLLGEAESSGHVWTPRDDLVSLASGLLGLDDELIESAIDRVLAEDIKRQYWVADSVKRIARRVLAEDERLIATGVLGLLQVEREQREVPDEVEAIGLNKDQAKAVKAALNSGCSILTGAPGTGKTHTIRAMLAAFKALNLSTVCMAPTGKAAKRMSDMTGHSASTIHRALGLRPNEAGGWDLDHARGNPLGQNVVIVDEVSMVDTWLMARLVDAVHPCSWLVLVGDPRQLPSVGPGAVLKDLMEAGVPSVELTEIMRQDPGAIVTACHTLKDGEVPDLYPLTPDDDLEFIDAETPEQVRDVIVDYVANRVPDGYDRLHECQVVCAIKRGSCGVKSLNEELQALFTVPPESDDERKNQFRLGDKVINTKNNPDQGIMNGDVGYVTAQFVDGNRRKVVVDFDGVGEVELEQYANALELAYAITCHKMQGSECPVVVIPIHKSNGAKVAQRNWLYTALSRASKRCVLVGHRAEFTRMCRRTKQVERMTGVVEAMSEAGGKGGSK